MARLFKVGGRWIDLTFVGYAEELGPDAGGGVRLVVRNGMPLDFDRGDAEAVRAWLDRHAEGPGGPPAPGAISPGHRLIRPPEAGGG